MRAFLCVAAAQRLFQPMVPAPAFPRAGLRGQPVPAETLVIDGDFLRAVVPESYAPEPVILAPGVARPAPAAVARHPPVKASVFPADSILRVVIVDGGLNFLALYQGIITLSILLSWFPQSRGIGPLQPVFVVSDVYLNLFRGIIPAIGGLDISPILAFFVLNLAQNALISL